MARKQAHCSVWTVLALVAVCLFLVLWHRVPGLAVFLLVCVGPRFWQWYSRLLR